MSYEEKLKELVKEVMGDEFKTLVAEEKDKAEETVAKMLEENSELKAKVEAMEKVPAVKVQLPIPGTDKTQPFLYKGYNLADQGLDLQLEDKDREVASKFLIDVITKTAMNETTTTQGGYLVPDEYANVLLAHARLNSVVLRDAQIYNMSTDTLRIPKEASNVSVSWTGEATALTASDPTFGEVVLTAKKLGAYSTASNELLADSSFDILSMLTSQFGEAIGQEIDNQSFNGISGTSTFTGILSGATTNTVTCAATGSSPSRHIQITVDELSEAISKLSSNKLMGSKFYIHRASLHYIRLLRDDNGMPIYALPGNSVPGTIYEYPYEIVEKLPSAPAAASGFIVFGNLKNYIIGQRKGTWSLEADPYGKFLEYQTRFRVVTRWDGDLGLEDGLCVIKTHA